MQLDKIVQYHKALSDATRIRMLALLAEGELNGQVLAEKLALTPATITFHAAKLREAALIYERREKNTIYFSLNPYFLKRGAEGVLGLVFHKRGDADMMEQDEYTRLRDSVIRNFFDAEGRLKSIPSQMKKKLIVLEHLVSRLENGRKYGESEINAFIKLVHDDFATIRREFIMHQFMFRENETYELNPRELWTKWEELK
ncbi:ArsR family transcriptional regulator [Paenibacillus sp. MY03]|uniref:ArsR family transcriptional regulator n=1 Tax=Paenibacillus agaridevorans TaxID=171404 RepID=A0A2R5EGR7_9BACL|nr:MULTISPECIES: metalloregulator ArsR/SmtB family transcription factor [Paenibacillus]OUS74931.1 ArsR family transcriptional regulator [Paenibacillus sp. MY03]QNK58939.1 metalloregulator ArsR/SmtB family transcription factor [Paenibacillus sp. PAMC21692]GBG05760.1 ArsR family transcriptional regulator [Paenibacillus agaridevorans]